MNLVFVDGEFVLRSDDVNEGVVLVYAEEWDKLMVEVKNELKIAERIMRFRDKAVASTDERMEKVWLGRAKHTVRKHKRGDVGSVYRRVEVVRDGVVMGVFEWAGAVLEEGALDSYGFRLLQPMVFDEKNDMSVIYERYNTAHCYWTPWAWDNMDSAFMESVIVAAEEQGDEVVVSESSLDDSVVVYRDEHQVVAVPLA